MAAAHGHRSLAQGLDSPKICAHTQRERKTLFQRASSLQNEAKYYLLSASSA